MAETTKYIACETLLDALGEEPLVWTDGADELQERNDWRRLRAIIEALPAADVALIRHGQWTEEKMQTLIPVEYDDAGEPILHDRVVYRCNHCGRAARKKEPYCHCGAKMDGYRLKEED